MFYRGIIMHESNKDIVISVKNISKHYKLYNDPKDRLKEALSFSNKKYYKEFKALDNISFEVKRGDIVGIIGKNGSGKSTLLKIITGVLSPSKGEVFVNGKIAALLELGAGFNPEYTGMENIFLQGTIMGFTRKEMEEKIDVILDFAEIGEFIHQPVKTYSSGMFVRLAFAVATQTLPDILIVDEALAVGDEKFQRKCYSYLEKMRKNGTTILFVSHAMTTVEQLCNHGILMESGEIIYIGTPKEVIDLYHDRIYALDADELKHLNSKASNSRDSQYIDKNNNVTKQIETTTAELKFNAKREVQITNIDVFKENEETFLFNTGDKSQIIVTIQNNTNEVIQDIIVGCKFRTKQGIEVYGNSTFYFEELPLSLAPHEKKQIKFEQNMNLMPGYYYLTYAVAKKKLSDMGYFDKLIDYTIIQIEDKNIKGSGIVNLFSNISIGEIGNEKNLNYNSKL